MSAEEARRSKSRDTAGAKSRRTAMKSPARGPFMRRGHLPAVIGLCIIHFVLAVTSARNKSNTYDEIAHLTRGYSYYMAGDYRLGPPHPPLAHYWAALPGLGAGVRFPPQHTPKNLLDDWYHSDMWGIGRQFFYYSNLGNAGIIDSLLLRGRAMIALWSVTLGLLTYWWARRLFGPGAGLLALGLYAFSPTMLAHAQLVTTDMAAALFFMCALSAIWWLLHDVHPLSVLASAASLAGLFLAKMSAVLIIPVGLVLLGLRLARGGVLPLRGFGRSREVRSRLSQLGCFLAVCCLWIVVVYASIWAAYGFRYAAMVNADPQRDHLYTNSPVPAGKTLWEHVLRGRPDEISDRFRATIFWLRDHRVFPEAYIYSAAYAKQTARGRRAFLDGEISLLGFPSFFPLTFAYKTPLPLTGMLLAGLAAIGLRGRIGEDSPVLACGRRMMELLYVSAPLWVFFVIYWYSSIGSRLNIGHRHIIPTYPMLFVCCGAAAMFWHARRKILRGVLVALAALFVAASVAIYPDYLAYFNLLAGGPANGYRRLVDSSLDWGQDLPGLAKALRERRGRDAGGAVYVSYFGSGGGPALKHYGVEGITLPQSWPSDAVGDLRYQPGLYAISATNLQQVYFGIRDSGGGQVYLNPWTPQLEETYQALLPKFDACMAAPNDAVSRAPWATGPGRREIMDFPTLQFARLCAYLRLRSPDATVHYSILLYDLDAAELAAALRGPIGEQP